jgi:hypothetical protein
MFDKLTDESLPDAKEELKAILAKLGACFGMSGDEAHEALVAGGLVITAGKWQDGPVRCHVNRIPPELRSPFPAEPKPKSKSKPQPRKPRASRPATPAKEAADATEARDVDADRLAGRRGRGGRAHDAVVASADADAGGDE